MAEVTDEDREKANEIILSGDSGPESWTQVLAAALAEEREKARAPFLALAEWLDVTEDPLRDDPSYIADIIRIALAEEG